MPKAVVQRPQKQVSPEHGKPAKTAKKGASVVDRIAPISMPETGIKLSLYGRSGTGKTTLACTFPKPLLLIRPEQLEDGRRSVYNVKGVFEAGVRKGDEVVDLVNFVKDTTEGARYKTVVFDNLTALQDLVLAEVLGKDVLPAQLSFGVAAREQWATTALMTKEILRSLLSLDTHVVVIAQEKSLEQEETSDLLMPSVVSALMPSVVGYLNPAVDYIGQTFLRKEKTKTKTVIAGKEKEVERETGRIEYCLRIGPHPVFTTKFRAPKGVTLPEVIVDPDYAKIDSLIQASK